MKRSPSVLIFGVLLAACARLPGAPGSADVGVAETSGTWRIMAEGPLSERAGTHAVWTGDEVLFWGGAGPGSEAEGGWGGLDDGAAYDLDADSWRRLQRAPIGAGAYSAVWTGAEMILWGAGGYGADAAEAGAAYDPSSDIWRMLERSPLEPRASHLAVWTGSEMIVWGGELVGRRGESYDGLGAAYDPRRDTWRVLPRGPLPAGYDAMGNWTGDEVLVVVTPMEAPPEGEPARMHAAAYEPEADRWRPLAQPPFAAWMGPPTAYLDGHHFALSTYGTIDGGTVAPFDRPVDTGGIYDVASDRWRSHRYPSIDRPLGMAPVAIAGGVVVDGLFYDATNDSWHPLPDLPVDVLGGAPSTAWTGRELVLWGGEELGGMAVIDPPPVVRSGAVYRPGEMT